MLGPSRGYDALQRVNNSLMPAAQHPLFLTELFYSDAVEQALFEGEADRGSLGSVPSDQQRRDLSRFGSNHA